MTLETSYIAKKLQNADFLEDLTKYKTCFEGFTKSDIMRDDFFAYLQVENIQPCKAVFLLCQLLSENGFSTPKNSKYKKNFIKITIKYITFTYLK